jgi:hypothetical protein
MQLTYHVRIIMIMIILFSTQLNSYANQHSGRMYVALSCATISAGQAIIPSAIAARRHPSAAAVGWVCCW